MSIFAPSIFAKAFLDFGNARIALIGSLAHLPTQNHIADYRTRVAKKYRALSPSEAASFLPDEELWISTKLDGELWFWVAVEGEHALVAPNGRVILDLPALKAFASAKNGTQNFIVAGELLAHSASGERVRSHHVSQLLGERSSTEALRFSAFDMVCEGELVCTELNFSERFAKLCAHFENLQSQLSKHDKDTASTFAIIEHQQSSKSDALKLYSQWVEKQNHEGMVARSTRHGDFKIKPSLTIDAVIVAFGSRTVSSLSGNVSEVRELQIALCDADGNFQLIGSVGTGLSGEQRTQLYELLMKDVCSSDRRLTNREGTLCRFVRPKHIVEIKATDLIATDASDRAITRLGFSYSPDGGYLGLSEKPTKVPIHPVFLRLRPDKSASFEDAGTSQLGQGANADAIAFDAFALDEGKDASSAEPSQRKHRAVFSKETKGQKAVRKFAIFASPGNQGQKPPYWLFFTDYSAGRKDPLDTQVVPAKDEESAIAIAKTWIEENVKKGWTEVREQRQGADWMS